MPQTKPENNSSFSLHKISKPRFSDKQITIEVKGTQNKAGLPKSPQKIVVGRNGKIGYK